MTNKKNFYDRCPNLDHFNAPLLIRNLSGIETLIWHREIEFDRVYSLRYIGYVIFKILF